jgi:exosome complex component MTR3
VFFFFALTDVWFQSHHFGGQDAEDRSIAVLIHQALVASIRLELFPKSTIDVFITIIENDGVEGCIAAGSVAASTALADAGVEMIGLVMSCSAVSFLSWHRVG